VSSSPLAGPTTTQPKSELMAALGSCRHAFIGVGAFSVLVNVLMLTGSLYMLEVYDRVLPSRSVPTLIGLSLLTAALFLFQGLLDMMRGRLLTRVGNQLDFALGPRIYHLIVRLPLRTRQGGDSIQPVRDLDTIRSFLSGTGPTVFFDLPWLPLYLAICFAFHFWIGMTALAGALVLVALTVMTEILARRPVRSASMHSAARMRFAETSRRNAEVLAAMGMSERLTDRWHALSRDLSGHQRRASDVAGGLGSFGRVFRMLLQSAVLGVGAYLVIQQEATAGIIIAASILTGRALAPVDLAIANWKGFLAARQSWQRLKQMLAALPAPTERLKLGPPSHGLTVEALAVAPPGTQKIVALDVNLALKAGNAVGIIGPSASGKSSLIRALVGIWLPARGVVRLDGAAIDQWTSADLGKYVGYLPQDVELIEGTIAENIARFDPDAPAEEIIAAAKSAGVHDMIVSFPNGYDTQIGEQGTALSAGQRQRVALARALYGDPFLVVLDEPNSNLDAEGEEALTRAIMGVRARGGIVIVVAHRPSALSAVDHVLAMSAGRQQAFGPKDEVLSKVLRREAPVPGPFKVVPQVSG
jgi:PrtD family type I secretion system ABC transporter